MPPCPDRETRAPFDLLSELFGDPELAAVFSETATIEAWLRVERELAHAQGDLGLLTQEQVTDICSGAVVEQIDSERLWREARNVGYPILPLVRMIAEQLPAGANGRVHLGATTQDIMDSGLAVQLCQALRQLDMRLCGLGDRLSRLVVAHGTTPMVARTHAQHAVPTTFGAKVAVYLGEFTRHRVRLRESIARICRVSLFGAAGTSAALGASASTVRLKLARRLGLYNVDLPWHVARDGVAEFGLLCALMLGTCGRLAREVVDLSRTEIAELGQVGGRHRGASSTMPQKVNPVLAEAVIGMAGCGGAMSSALIRAMEAGHERAAGEWQIEWAVVPQVACLCGGALARSSEMVRDLTVDPPAMAANLAMTKGQVLAEAYMMSLAPAMGRERAHDLVYAAAERARASRRHLREEIAELVQDPSDLVEVTATDYLGEVERSCAAALAAWQEEREVRPPWPETVEGDTATETPES